MIRYRPQYKRTHTALKILNNQNEMIKLAKVKKINRGRLCDDKNNFVSSNIVSIVSGIPTHSILNHIRHIDVPKNTKYRLFRRGNVKRKKLINAKVDINWSSEKKRIKQNSKVNYELMIQIQDWIMKHHNIIHSPITEDTLLVNDEYTGKYF